MKHNSFLHNFKVLSQQHQEYTLKVPNHESYTQRRAPPRARLLTSRRSAPFPLALGFSAAIPAASRVAPSAYGPPCPALSRLGQRGVTVFSRGVTLLFHVLARLYLCPAQFAPVPPTDIEGLQELRQNVAKYAGQR